MYRTQDELSEKISLNHYLKKNVSLNSSLLFFSSKFCKKMVIFTEISTYNAFLFLLFLLSNMLNSQFVFLSGIYVIYFKK